MTRPTGDTSPRPYHHGDLRRELLDIAGGIAATEGPSAIGMRELARRADVSHAAPAHHFGDKRGLLTALAVEGFDRLTESLEGVLARGAPFADQGVAYVVFAVGHPGHFAVMWRFDLLDRESPELARSSLAARAALDAGAARLAADTGVDASTAATAAWSFAHGLATLLNARLIDPGPDLGAFVRRAAGLFAAGPPAVQG